MKLSEFKDEKAIEVVAKILEPISVIVANSKTKINKGDNAAKLASELLTNNPKEVKDILAILSDKPKEEYHCTAATVMRDVIEMFSDEELLSLFISQG